MPRRSVLLVVPAVAVLAACAGVPPTAGPAAQPVAPAPVGVTATVVAPVPVPDAVTPPDAVGSWVMPNLVGVVLQDAQDRIQALTGNAIFLTTSHDATGAGRHQVLDRNWRVCDQSVAPGRSITVTTKIDFGAVKLTERC